MIYEYKCSICGVFENLQRNHTPIKKCPVCKGNVTKLISLSSFKLVGEGWTKTEQFNDKVALTEEKLKQEDIAEDIAIAKHKSKLSKKLGEMVKDKLGNKGMKNVRT